MKPIRLPVVEPRKNVYRCITCQREIVTLDIDNGVTPMFLACIVTRDCKGMMNSSFYNCDPSRPHQYEWFMPNDFSKYDPSYVDHFKRGGLDLRRRVIGGETIERDIVDFVRSLETITASLLQRKFRQTYMTAKNLMDRLISAGVVFPEKDSHGALIVVREVAWAGDGES